MPNLRRAVKFAATASALPALIAQVALIVAWMDAFPDAFPDVLTDVAPILWILRDLFDHPLPRNYLVVFLGITLLGWLLLPGYVRNPARRTLSGNRRFWNLSLYFHGSQAGFYLAPLILFLLFGGIYSLHTLDISQNIALGILLTLLFYAISMMLGSGYLARAYRELLLKEAEMCQLAAMVAEDQREAAAEAAAYDQAKPPHP